MMTINESVFDRFPVLKTKRLLLREIMDEDAQAIFEMRQYPGLNRFITREAPDSLEQVSEVVDKCKKSFITRQGIAWAALLREGEKMIGTCGFNRIEPQNLRAELGGELSSRYWGKGIALEAVEAIIAFGMVEMKLHSIEARLWPENRGAIAILEYLGFEKEAHFKEACYFQGRFIDIAVYTLI